MKKTWEEDNLLLREASQNDYHTSPKKLRMTFDQFKVYTSEHFEILWKYLKKLAEESTDEQTFGEESKHKVLTKYIPSFIRTIEKQIKDDKMIIYRILGLSKLEYLDLDSLGICWTWNPKNLDYIWDNVLEEREDKYEVRLIAETPLSNIDWIESLFLYIQYLGDEEEIRLLDSKPIKLQAYVILEEVDDHTKKVIASSGNWSLVKSKTYEILRTKKTSRESKVYAKEIEAILRAYEKHGPWKIHPTGIDVKYGIVQYDDPIPQFIENVTGLKLDRSDKKYQSEIDNFTIFSNTYTFYSDSSDVDLHVKSMESKENKIAKDARITYSIASVADSPV